MFSGMRSIQLRSISTAPASSFDSCGEALPWHAALAIDNPTQRASTWRLRMSGRLAPIPAVLRRAEDPQRAGRAALDLALALLRTAADRANQEVHVVDLDLA